MHADTNSPVDTRLMCEAGGLLPKRRHQPEAGADRPLGIIVMGLRIAKVDHQLLPPILGDLALKLPDDAGTRLLIGTDHGIEVVRGQGPGERGLGSEGAHQDSELSPFAVEHSGQRPGGSLLSRRLVRESRVDRGSRQTILLSPLEHRWRGSWVERRRYVLGFRGTRRPFFHGYEKAIPCPIDRLDEPWATPAVSNGLAYSFHRTGERRVANELLWPDLITQLLLRDDPIGMRQQVGQDLERFTPQPPDTPGAGQRITVRIEGILAKDIQHRGPPFT
jgi:hypothetical protein